MKFHYPDTRQLYQVYIIIYNYKILFSLMAHLYLPLFPARQYSLPAIFASINYRVGHIYDLSFFLEKKIRGLGQL